MSDNFKKEKPPKQPKQPKQPKEDKAAEKQKKAEKAAAQKAAIQKEKKEKPVRSKTRFHGGTFVLGMFSVVLVAAASLDMTPQRLYKFSAGFCGARTTSCLPQFNCFGIFIDTIAIE